MATITDALKAHFESQPNLQQIWLNEAGEWQHFNHPAYPECVTRDEVLSSKVTETKVKKQKPAEEKEAE